MTELFGFLGASIYGEKEAAMRVNNQMSMMRTVNSRHVKDADKIIQHATLLDETLRAIGSSIWQAIDGHLFRKLSRHLVKGQKAYVTIYSRLNLITFWYFLDHQIWSFPLTCPKGCSFKITRSHVEGQGAYPYGLLSAQNGHQHKLHNDQASFSTKSHPSRVSHNPQSFIIRLLYCVMSLLLRKASHFARLPVAPPKSEWMCSSTGAD